MAEKVLLIVHYDSLVEWSKGKDTDGISAQTLLLSILQAEGNYLKTLSFPHDPWEPEWNPRDTKYTWESIAQGLEGYTVDVCGIQKDLCVAKVTHELKAHGVSAQIREDLCINSVFLK